MSEIKNKKSTLLLCLLSGVLISPVAANRYPVVTTVSEADSSAALYQLGVMRMNGEGVKQDIVQGRYWIHLAARHGYPLAQYNLGVMYFDGIGGTYSRQCAQWWLNRAAAQNDTDVRQMAGRALQTIMPELEKLPKVYRPVTGIECDRLPDWQLVTHSVDNLADLPEGDIDTETIFIDKEEPVSFLTSTVQSTQSAVETEVTNDITTNTKASDSESKNVRETLTEPIDVTTQKVHIENNPEKISAGNKEEEDSILSAEQNKVSKSDENFANSHLDTADLGIGDNIQSTKILVDTEKSESIVPDSDVVNNTDTTQEDATMFIPDEHAETGNVSEEQIEGNSQHAETARGSEEQIERNPEHAETGRGSEEQIEGNPERGETGRGSEEQIEGNPEQAEPDLSGQLQKENVMSPSLGPQKPAIPKPRDERPPLILNLGGNPATALGKHYTLQLSGGTTQDELYKTARRYKLTNYLVYETVRNGQRWYVLVFGEYSTLSSATKALKELPPELRKRGPWVRSIKHVQSELHK